jgi:site-specific DNA-methyltransferase (adenine-specific)
MIQLLHGDCLEVMRGIPDHSIDAIIADLPYGTTACSWDAVIPFEPLWAQYKRVIKPAGAVVLFGSQPFFTDVVMSNRAWFRYEIIWEKSLATGYLNANRNPMKAHELIGVFYSELGTYNPQKSKGIAYRATSGAVGFRLDHLRVKW